MSMHNKARNNRPIYEPLEGEGKTQQHFKHECDINHIIKKFTATGLLEHVKTQAQQFTYNESQSYSEAMSIVAQANEQFMTLPSEVRAHFKNDPADFLDAAHDETREDEFIELGLLPVRSSPEPKDQENKEPRQRRLEDAPPKETAEPVDKVE